ncbi:MULTISPECIES: hypothetical protein [Burkholderia]|nr:hypothetical protein [Burkholderia cepacia]MDN7618029.1 hypothetical protein [Burkholderia cepacia]MDN7765255.1 hypothetical protein [Burkholderia cepacia]
MKIGTLRPHACKAPVGEELRRFDRARRISKKIVNYYQDSSS